MLLQKTFHVRLSAPETKARLENVASYQRMLNGASRVIANEAGATECEFTTRTGFRGKFELVSIPSDQAEQTVFRSTGGNISVVGMLEYFTIRDGLTEVQLTVEYSIKPTLQSVLDKITASVEHYVDQQLHRIETHLGGLSRGGQPRGARASASLERAHFAQ